MKEIKDYEIIFFILEILIFIGILAIIIFGIKEILNLF